jgi:ketosteroid isomerase-like protein
MSEENVEIVRSIYDHFNQIGELKWDLFHSEAVLDASSTPGFGIVRGRDAALAALRDYAAPFEDWRVEPEEIVDAGGSYVFAAVRDGGRIKGTQDEIFNRFFHAWELRDGKVIAWRTFQTREQALEAAGLSE